MAWNSAACDGKSPHDAARVTPLSIRSKTIRAGVPADRGKTGEAPLIQPRAGQTRSLFKHFINCLLMMLIDGKRSATGNRDGPGQEDRGRAVTAGYPLPGLALLEPDPAALVGHAVGYLSTDRLASDSAVRVRTWHWLGSDEPTVCCRLTNCTFSFGFVAVNSCGVDTL